MHNVPSLTVSVPSNTAFERTAQSCAYLTNIGLEEVEYEDQSGEWIVTIGFSRPWDEPRNTLAVLAAGNAPRRAYKVVRISNDSNQVLSVKNRETKS